MEVEYLCHSDNIRAKIQAMFSRQNAQRRRVIIVAYIGKDATSFLAYARGVEIYCWPLAGATNPAGVSELEGKGARIYFAQGLHSKVYWVEGVGGLITSANLSASALDDRQVRHEAGVFISTMGEDVIDNLIAESNAHAMTKLAFARLQQEHEAFWLRDRGRQLRHRRAMVAGSGASYAEWYKVRLPKWKVNCPTGKLSVGLQGVAKKEAVRRTRRDGIDVHDYINGYKGEYTSDDWVLYLEPATRGRVRDFSWVRLDYYIPVGNKARQDCLYQGVQIFPLPAEVEPPFKLDETFKRAFSEAFRPGVDNQYEKPSRRLLSDIFVWYSDLTRNASE